MLAQEIQSGKRPKFDFIFIDADKENNLNYFNLCMDGDMVKKPGACFYIDNIVRQAKIVDEKFVGRKDSRVMGARAAIEGIGADERVEGVVLQTVSEKNYDGFLMAVVK